MKPNIGMLEKCVATLGCLLKEVELYFIGDRSLDVELSLNGGGKGILVSSQKTIELGDLEKARKLQEKNSGRVYIAENFLDAAGYVKYN